MTETTTERPRSEPGHSRPDQPESPGANLVPLVIVVGLLTWLGVAAGWEWVVVLLGIIVMIFFHELGHYLTGKWGGMKVTEFFIGFGPRIWSFRKGETEYGFKPILAGAYVKVIGMNNLEEVDPADEPRTYRAQPYWRRLSVGVAGSAMHFIMALVLLYVAFVSVGITEVDNWVVSEVTGESAAQQAGLQPGDRLLSIDGEEVDTFGEVGDVVRPRAGDEVTIVFDRDGQTIERQVELGSRNPDGDRVGFLGISPEHLARDENPVAAIPATAAKFGDITWQSVKALGSFFTPGSIEDYADTVSQGGTSTASTDPDAAAEPAEDGNRFISILGALQIGAAATKSGLEAFLLFFVLINIFIGIFNMIPLLPLDGGHVAIATYEKIRSSITGRPHRVDIAKLLPITYAVVLVLVMIGITALYLDVVDPVAP